MSEWSKLAGELQARVKDLVEGAVKGRPGWRLLNGRKADRPFNGYLLLEQREIGMPMGEIQVRVSGNDIEAPWVAVMHKVGAATRVGGVMFADEAKLVEKRRMDVVDGDQLAQAITELRSAVAEWLGAEAEGLVSLPSLTQRLAAAQSVATNNKFKVI